MIIGPGFLFVHIPKTGGSSIWEAIKNSDTKSFSLRESFPHGNIHFRPSELNETIQPEFSFCFVRNPWDRLVSWRCWNHPTVPFENWLEGHIKNRNVPSLTQSEYLSDFDFDFIGRFELIRKDWRRAAAKIGLKKIARLPHLKKSRRKPYQSYYTPEMVRTVAELESPLIERFGYTFE
jgi:hypothetical protein